MASARYLKPQIGRDAVALVPRPDSCDRAASQFDDCAVTGIAENVSVSSHDSVMHYALQQRKCLLHNGGNYHARMTDAAERLRIARLRAGFETAKDAAEAMGFAVSTYLAHENGSRGYPAKKAEIYARKFKVREQWLLYGVGEGPGENGDQKAEIINIIDRLPPLKRAEALGYLRGLSQGGDNS